MLEYLKSAREGIARTVSELLSAREAEFGSAFPGLGDEAARSLAEFSCRGKMLRGCLVKLGFELGCGREAGGVELRAVQLAGAAMELFQSGLLVHDDIMDGDRTRRGAPTVHAAYEAALAGAEFRSPARTAESLAICVGDLAYFEAFRALSALPVEPARAQAAIGLAARELSMVGVAQMRDVKNGAASGAKPSEDEILAMYRYKTGRYTFSLPLALGAALAGAPSEASRALEEAGEELGIAFQLKDDELGLFALEAELGKPVGSDVREDKKTIHRLRLFQRAEGQAAERLRSMFGCSRPEDIDMAFVRKSAEALGVKAELEAEMRRRVGLAEARSAALAAKAPPAAASAWRELGAYSLSRRS